MKDKILILGAGGFGREASEFIRKEYDCAFVDDSCFDSTVCDIPVVGKMSDLPKLFGEYKKAVIPIGNSTVREKLFTECLNIGYELPNIICDDVYISPYATIGEGCILLSRVMVQHGASVGRGVILHPNVEVHLGGTMEDFTMAYTNSVIMTGAVVTKGKTVPSTTTIEKNQTY